MRKRNLYVSFSFSKLENRATGRQCDRQTDGWNAVLCVLSHVEQMTVGRLVLKTESRNFPTVIAGELSKGLSILKYRTEDKRDGKCTWKSTVFICKRVLLFR